MACIFYVNEECLYEEKQINRCNYHRCFIGTIIVFSSRQNVWRRNIRSYNARTVEEAILQENNDLKFKQLCEPIDAETNNKEFNIVVYTDGSEEKIYCAFTEKKGNRYAFIYSYSFEPSEITEKSGLTAYDLYRGCDLTVGIAPSSDKKIVINGETTAESENFDFKDNHYCVWYAVVKDGVDGIGTVEYT